MDLDGARTGTHAGLHGGHDRVEGQPIGRDGRERPADPLEDRPRGIGVERKRNFEDRFPALEAGRVGIPQHLDVHQPVAHFDVVRAGREQVHLVALLDGGRRHCIERGVGEWGGRCEGAPFPAREDLGHALLLLTISRRCP